MTPVVPSPWRRLAARLFPRWAAGLTHPVGPAIEPAGPAVDLAGATVESPNEPWPAEAPPPPKPLSLGEIRERLEAYQDLPGLAHYPAVADLEPALLALREERPSAWVRLRPFLWRLARLSLPGTLDPARYESAPLTSVPTASALVALRVLAQERELTSAEVDELVALFARLPGRHFNDRAERDFAADTFKFLPNLLVNPSATSHAWMRAMWGNLPGVDVVLATHPPAFQDQHVRGRLLYSGSPEVMLAILQDPTFPDWEKTAVSLSKFYPDRFLTATKSFSDEQLSRIPPGALEPLFTARPGTVDHDEALALLAGMGAATERLRVQAEFMAAREAASREGAAREAAASDAPAAPMSEARPLARPARSATI